jgi:hypothetical protein
LWRTLQHPAALQPELDDVAGIRTAAGLKAAL